MNFPSAAPVTGIDYQRIFESIPGLFLVLSPDVKFTIFGASEAYLHATNKQRDTIVGRGIFEVFGDCADHNAVATMTNLRASLARVIAAKTADAMAVQRYDLPRPAGGEPEARFWSPVNSPVLSERGEILYIVHRVEDVTASVRVERNLRATDILESIAEGFFALDREWRFTYLNREGERIRPRHMGRI